MINWIVDIESSVDDDLLIAVHEINDNNKQRVIKVTANLGPLMFHLLGSLLIELFFITSKYIKELLNGQPKV
jgi:hypothetical protein